MNSEDQIILAFIFKRSGKNSLKESEIYLPLSMNLKWFSLQEAKEFVKRNIQQNNLIKKDTMLTASFNINDVSIPTGFHPTKNSNLQHQSITKENQSVLTKIIDTIANKTGKKPQEILEELSKVQNDKNIIKEVAALYIANNLGCDVSTFFPEIQNAIFTENTK